MCETRSMKRHAPATERNREPLLAVLREVLPATGRVLEVASGTGQHAAWFARALPHLTWQPTDVDAESLESIEAWRAGEDLPNLLPPRQLDASAASWPQADADVILNVNMIHISPWAACQGLMRGAGRVLPPGGLLILYGPYFVEGRQTAPSNLEFDASLRARNPAWGVRTLEAVTAEAALNGLERERVVDMPSNNLTVVFRKPRPPGSPR
ncbi:SAM-dependent methyltransferase [Corallococcus macrosporus DSM 14697]|uniref:SAM-dependent methyltransferase n=2 Tax=Corallococcus macrosporus TaxID=35 RepID=A0A250JMX1_9BACT|nr:SAM-dependent methyltransferase [Corallococcus macrosporus DSM 14697]